MSTPAKTELRRVLLVAAGLGLVMAGVLSWGLRGSVFHLVVAAAGLVVFAPSVVVGCAWLLLAKRAGRDASVSALGLTPLCAVTLVSGAVFGSGFLGVAWNEHDMRALRARADALASRLEAYRSEHGEYPVRFEELQLPGETWPSCFTNGRVGYHSEGEWYLFDIADHYGLFSGWQYLSKTGTWTHHGS